MENFDNYIDNIVVDDNFTEFQELLNIQETPDDIINYNSDIITRLDTIIENQVVADNHNLISTPLIVMLTFIVIIALVVKFIKNLFWKGDT